MKPSATTLVLGLFFTAGAGMLFAQWPDYPMGGPRSSNGKIDMNAPTPRTPDGHPDLSGIWGFAGGGGGRGRGGQGRGGAGRGGRGGAGGPAADAAPPPPPPPPAPTDGPPLGQFFNIGAGFPGQTLPFQPWAAELRAKRKADNNKDNPDAHCLPLGLTQLHMHPQPRKIIQTSNLIVMLYEAQGGIRQIFMDGRQLPTQDAEPWYYGYSVGHWDGDDLVVETNGFRDDVWLDVEGSPLTNSGTMIERFRRPNFGTMQIDVTVDDPKVYTAPWTVRINHRLMADTDLIEFVCEDRDAGHYVGKENPK